MTTTEKCTQCHRLKAAYGSAMSDLTYAARKRSRVRAGVSTTGLDKRIADAQRWKQEIASQQAAHMKEEHDG